MEALGGVGFTHDAVSNHYFLEAVKNPVSLPKNIVLASIFFIYIFNMSVTYPQSAEKIQRKLL